MKILAYSQARPALPNTTFAAAGGKKAPTLAQAAKTKTEAYRKFMDARSGLLTACSPVLGMELFDTVTVQPFLEKLEAVKLIPEAVRTSYVTKWNTLFPDPTRTIHPPNLTSETFAPEIRAISKAIASNVPNYKFHPVQALIGENLENLLKPNFNEGRGWSHGMYFDRYALAKALQLKAKKSDALNTAIQTFEKTGKAFVKATANFNTANDASTSTVPHGSAGSASPSLRPASTLQPRRQRRRGGTK